MDPKSRGHFSHKRAHTHASHSSQANYSSSMCSPLLDFSAVSLHHFPSFWNPQFPILLIPPVPIHLSACACSKSACNITAQADLSMSTLIIHNSLHYKPYTQFIVYWQSGKITFSLNPQLNNHTFALKHLLVPLCLFLCVHMKAQSIYRSAVFSLVVFKRVLCERLFPSASHNSYSQLNSL